MKTASQQTKPKLAQSRKWWNADELAIVPRFVPVATYIYLMFSNTYAASEFWECSLSYQSLSKTHKNPLEWPYGGYTQRGKSDSSHLSPEKNYIKFHKTIFKSQNLTKLITFV